MLGAQCSNPAMSIIGAEDEDFENDLNDVSEMRADCCGIIICTSSLSSLILLHIPLTSSLSLCVSSVSQVVDDQCTCFGSIEQLKDRPTHLLVFMQHVILQFDPAPLVSTIHNQTPSLHTVLFSTTFNQSVFMTPILTLLNPFKWCFY